MLVKNRCFELFEQRENSAKFAVLFFHVGICSFIQQMLVHTNYVQGTVGDLPERVDGVARDFKIYTNNFSTGEM